LWSEYLKSKTSARRSVAPVNSTSGGGITDITEKSRLSHIRYPRWDDRQKGTFYFLSDNTLYTWSAETLDTPPVALIPQMSGYDISQNFIYFIDRNTGIVFRLKSDDSIENAEQITEQEIPNPSAPASLTVYDEDRIAIRNRDNGALFIFNRGQEDYFHSLGDNIRSVQFSNQQTSPTSSPKKAYTQFKYTAHPIK
jgi:hypothetical protein